MITDFQKILRWGRNGEITVPPYGCESNLRGMDVNSSLGKSPLLFHFASCPSKGDNFKILRMLIDLGADLNAQDDLGLTCISRAQGQSLSAVKTVRLLVEAGADLDVQDKRYRNRTVLMISLYDFCALDIISMLVHAGANVNLRNTRKMTALMYAVTPEDIQYQAGYPEKAVRMLIDAGCWAQLC